MKDLNKMYAEKIAAEYAVKKETKVVALKKLDNKVKKPANIFAYSFGIIGALVLGVGMCLAMGKIGANNTASMVWGIIIGVIGIAMVSVNYYIYSRILASRREKYAYEITELAKEIVNE